MYGAILLSKYNEIIHTFGNIEFCKTFSCKLPVVSNCHTKHHFIKEQQQNNISSSSSTSGVSSSSIDSLELIEEKENRLHDNQKKNSVQSRSHNFDSKAKSASKNMLKSNKIWV